MSESRIEHYVDEKVEFSHGLYFHPDVWDKNDRLLEADKFTRYGAYMLIYVMLIAIPVAFGIVALTWGVLTLTGAEYDPQFENLFGPIAGMIVGWCFGVSVTVMKYKSLVKSVSP